MLKIHRVPVVVGVAKCMPAFAEQFWDAKYADISSWKTRFSLKTMFFTR